MKKLKYLGQKGFTLIEVLMAVLIIVILAVVGITQFNNFAADAKDAATKSNLAILRNSIGTMNALERVRCAKTSVLFPDVGTVQNDDITGCTGAVATAACYPVTLINSSLAVPAAYGTCAAGLAAGAYLTLIPLIDRPFVQNRIPDNPWTGPVATTARNKVLGDVAVFTGTAVCGNAPVSIGAVTAATQCNSAAAAGGPHGGTPFAAASLTQAGWCYCQDTGQIWANTANNDGGNGTTGMESTF